jgi:two-component system invasion response regulator UvrY
MKKVSIMIVDDHALIRETCSHLLNLQPNLEVVAVTGDSEQSVEMVRNKRPDIILLDINMESVNGFDLVSLFRRNSPLSKVIALSTNVQPVFVKKVIRLGARGYLTKNSPVSEMIQAINDVSSGSNYLPNEIKNILSEDALDEDPDKIDINSLSERELQVMKLLKRGLSSRDIAAELTITTRTVEVHRHHILKKLKMKNTIAAIAYFNSIDF